MKILIVSDSHGNTELLKNIVGMNRTCDLIIHLGDNAYDCDEIKREFPTMALLSVIGNCDLGFSLNNVNTEGSFTAEGRRIFYTHGHRYGGVDALVYQAKMKKADIALFGHTHVNFHDTIGGVLVINPGSISLPRDGTGGTYCVMEIHDKEVKYEIKEVIK